MDTQKAFPLYRELPEYAAFEKWWTKVSGRIQELGGHIPTESDRNIAEHWFMLGWSAGRFRA